MLKHMLQKNLSFALTIVLFLISGQITVNASTPILSSTPTSIVTPTSSTTPTSTTTPTSSITPTSINTPMPAATPTAKEPIPDKIPSAANFKDISNHWAKNHISTLILNNIINGYSDGTIRPDNEITRSEIAVILAKTIKLEMKNTNVNAFKDYKNIPEWSLSYVN